MQCHSNTNKVYGKINLYIQIHPKTISLHLTIDILIKSVTEILKMGILIL